jgi:MSHA biogenesis protein MshI
MLAFFEKDGLLTFTRGGELYLARRIEVTVSQVIDTDADRRNQVFERIALELQRSLDNFDRNYHYVPIAKLLIAPLPQECGLLEYLAPNLSVPVESIDLGSVLDFPAIPDLKHPSRQSQCFEAIGAALRTDAAAA